MCDHATVQHACIAGVSASSSGQKAHHSCCSEANTHDDVEAAVADACIRGQLIREVSKVTRQSKHGTRPDELALEAIGRRLISRSSHSDANRNTAHQKNNSYV